MNEIKQTLQQDADALLKRLQQSRKNGTGVTLSVNDVGVLCEHIAALEIKIQEPKLLLTCAQLKEAYNYGSPDGTPEQDETEMVIGEFNKGHSGKGLYCYYADLPEEGAIYLDEETSHD